MNHADNDDDMNLDDAMFLDRMSHLQVQIDEKIQSIIDKLAQDLFDANPNEMLLARIQVIDDAEEKSKKHVKVDDVLFGYLNTNVNMASDFPVITVDFEKIAACDKEPSKQNRNGFMNFLRGKASA